jgi:hypothetical protein
MLTFGQCNQALTCLHFEAHNILPVPLRSLACCDENDVVLAYYNPGHSAHIGYVYIVSAVYAKRIFNFWMPHALT